MVSSSADSSDDKRSSPLSIKCRTAPTMWSYSASVSMALITTRFASRVYFLGSMVKVTLIFSTFLSYTRAASWCRIRAAALVKMLPNPQIQSYTWSCLHSRPTRGGAMEIDRRALIASLGGMAAVSMMSSEAKADAIEDYASQQLDDEVAEEQEATGN